MTDLRTTENDAMLAVPYGERPYARKSRWVSYAEHCRHVESRLTASMDGAKIMRCIFCNVERETRIGDFESRLNFAENHTDCRHDAPFGEGPE